MATNQKIAEAVHRLRTALSASAEYDFYKMVVQPFEWGWREMQREPTQPLFPVLPSRAQAGDPLTDVQLGGYDIARLRAPEGTLRVPFSPILMVGRPPDSIAIAEAIQAAEHAFMDEVTIRVPAPGHQLPAPTLGGIPFPLPGHYLRINLLRDD